MKPANYFLQTVQHLRQYEEVLLFANLLRVSEEDQKEAVRYLASEYKEEAVNYPYRPPPFDEAAALWAAKTVYVAAQLLLYRENKEADLPPLLPAYEGTVTASAVLSADLLLRFLPDVLLQLKAIDPDDALIAVLERHLRTWHYSGVRYAMPVDALDFSLLQSSPPLRQLYVDRVIQYKNSPLAKHDAIRQGVKASLGLYASPFWNEFKTKEAEHETR